MLKGAPGGGVRPRGKSSRAARLTVFWELVLRVNGERLIAWLRSGIIFPYARWLCGVVCNFGGITSFYTCAVSLWKGLVVMGSMILLCR